MSETETSGPAGGALCAEAGVSAALPALVPNARPAAAGPGPGRRLLPWLLALLLLAAAAGAAWFVWLRPVAVTVAEAHRGLAVEAVYATGVVEAVDTARVGTTIAGRIVALAAQEGDSVHAGQVLARLDDQAARQRLEDARAQLRLAEQELARDAALLPQGVRTLQAVQRSQEARDRAAAAVAIAERGLADTVITSPLDGIVMLRPVEEGETVAANAVLFSVAAPSPLRVAADVDERDIAEVRTGAPVAIRADAFPDRVVQARVTNIRRQGDATTRTYRVEAALPAGAPLLIGMTVDVNIEVARRENAILVPESAVVHAASQGGLPGAAFVFVAREGRAVRTPVTLGAVGGREAEIRAGLAVGARVLADPPDGLADGARIAPRGAP